jgi:hypothetical protein
MDDRWWKPVTGIANLFHPFLLSWIQQVRRVNVTMPAGHMTATRMIKINSNQPLHKRGRPHMTAPHKCLVKL